MGGSGVLHAYNTVTTNSGAVFDMAGNNETIDGLIGTGGTVTNSAVAVKHPVHQLRQLVHLRRL